MLSLDLVSSVSVFVSRCVLSLCVPGVLLLIQLLFAALDAPSSSSSFALWYLSLSVPAVICAARGPLLTTLSLVYMKDISLPSTGK